MRQSKFLELPIGTALLEKFDNWWFVHVKVDKFTTVYVYELSIPDCDVSGEELNLDTPKMFDISSIIDSEVAPKWIQECFK